MRLRYFTLSILILYFQIPAISQVYIGLDGLTCSMCSNSVYRSLLQVPGVKEVNMDLNENVAEVVLKEKATPAFRDLSQKVLDAGYSVRFIKVKIPFKEFTTSYGKVFHFNGNDYIYIGSEEKKLDDFTTVSIIGKGFATKKELKKWVQAITDYKLSISSNSYFFTL